MHYLLRKKLDNKRERLLKDFPFYAFKIYLDSLQTV